MRVHARAYKRPVQSACERRSSGNRSRLWYALWLLVSRLYIIGLVSSILYYSIALLWINGEWSHVAETSGQLGRWKIRFWCSATWELRRHGSLEFMGLARSSSDPWVKNLCYCWRSNPTVSPVWLLCTLESYRRGDPIPTTCTITASQDASMILTLWKSWQEHLTDNVFHSSVHSFCDMHSNWSRANDVEVLCMDIMLVLN